MHAGNGNRARPETWELLEEQLEPQALVVRPLPPVQRGHEDRREMEYILAKNGTKDETAKAPDGDSRREGDWSAVPEHA